MPSVQAMYSLPLTRPVPAVPDGSCVYNVSYIVGLFGEPNQAKYTANIERGIDTSGILTMDYSGFKAVSIAAKDCAAPARYIIQARRLYPAEVYRQLLRRHHLPP